MKEITEDCGAQKREISIKDARLMTNLLTCTSVDAAAKASELGRSTVYRHLADPAFRNELRRRRNELTDVAMDAFKVHSFKAMDTLVGLMDSKNESVRRKAANDIWSYVFRSRELQDAEERLEALEGVRQ